MKTRKLLFCINLFLPVIISSAFAQALSYTDPATAYARILMEKSGEGSYRQISNYKVTGSPYLFEEKLSGNIYTPTEKALNVQLSYDTYYQVVEIYQGNNE